MRSLEIRGMIIVLLPAYNEALGIQRLLERINRVLGNLEYQIVVVDDGSMDGTGDLVREASEHRTITLLSHAVNCGLGRAMYTGLEYVCSHWSAEDVLVTMDADNTHDPELIPEMLQVMEQGADIVIASRFVSRGDQIGLSWFRRLLSGGARVVLRRLFPLDVEDYTCGYRLYRLGLLQKAMSVYEPLVEANGFAVMVEILLKLSRLSPTVAQVPLVLRYDLKEGASKLRLVRTLIEYGKILLRLWLHKPVSS